MACLTITAGLLAGYADRASLALRAIIVEPLVFVGHHAWWAAPLTTTLLFGLIGGAASVLMAPTRWRGQRWRVLVWLFAFAGAFAALYSFPQIQRIASLVLSAGLATVLARRLGGFSDLGGKRTRWMAAGLTGLTAAIMVGTIAADAIRERRLNPANRAAQAGRNVILIVLDTVRAMSLSLYGYHRDTSPNLTRWASRGVAFTRAYSTAPWTLPSHASMLTGRWMHEMSADWMVPLDHTFPTLAEVLSARGYRTGGFVANTDYCSAEVGLDRGFGHFEDYTLAPGQLLRNSSLWRAIARITIVRRVLGHYDNLGRRTAPEISQAFLDWQAKAPSRPFFAFLNYYDAHRPYLAPAGWAGRFKTAGVEPNPRLRKELDDPKAPPEVVQGAIDAYDDAIGYLDHEIGRLLDELDRRGLVDNSIIVITSDHGEEFLEHGLWDHGHGLYHPAIHVPLLVIAPGAAPTDQRADAPVSLRSIPATVAELLSITDSPFPGRSLGATWAGGPGDSVLVGVRQVPRQPAWYPVSRGSVGSVITGNWQFIRNAGDGEEEWFAIEAGGARSVRTAPDSATGSLGTAFRALVTDMFPNPR